MAFSARRPGQRIYVSNESEDGTYSAVVGPTARSADLQPFAERGGESCRRGSHGNVYVANGQIFVYTPRENRSPRSMCPSGPLHIVFGGADGRTLFILSHHALYAVKVRAAAR